MLQAIHIQEVLCSQLKVHRDACVLHRLHKGFEGRREGFPGIGVEVCHDVRREHHATVAQRGHAPNHVEGGVKVVGPVVHTGHEVTVHIPSQLAKRSG